MEITSNRHVRPLVGLFDVPPAVAADQFAYMFNAQGETTGYYISDAGNDPRFFEYRGYWYDVQEFTRTGDDLTAKGWHGIQPDSAWSAIIVSQWDRDGEFLYDAVIVGSVYSG